MAYDYNKLYGETSDALGPPTAVFVDFFNRFDRRKARILDVGCGQGRDAVFIAGHGHTVVGVDISPNGIRDLEQAAKRENLNIQGVVADIASYTPAGVFDVILIDRTLHMLPKASRLRVLAGLLDHVRSDGWILIADEKSNLPAFENVISDHCFDWVTKLRMRGYLFVRRT